MFGPFVKFCRPSLLEAVQRSLQLVFLVSFLYRLFHGTIALTTYLTVFLNCFSSTIMKYVSSVFTLNDNFRQRLLFINTRSRLSVAFLPAFREFRVDLGLPDFLCLLILSNEYELFVGRILDTSALKAAMQKQNCSVRRRERRNFYVNMCSLSPIVQRLK